MLPYLMGNQAIKNQLSGKLSHAYLVAGAEGSGRGVVLQHIAQKALCDFPQETACGTCKSCLKMERNSHPDFKTYGWDKAINVEAVRDLQKDINVLPNDSSRTIFVIFHGDEMNPSTQNALLKSLEEPPSHALFVIITGESGGVLETIRSRCHCLTLRPISYGESLQWLQQKYPSISVGLEETAQRCQGILGVALDEMEPMRKKMNLQEVQQHPQAEQFHLATKGRSTVGKKVVKKASSKKTKKPEIENAELQQIMEKIGQQMLRGTELQLFQSCTALEKIGKEQLLEIFGGLIVYLSRACIHEKRREILKYRSLMEEIYQAVEGNVGGGTVVGWLTAGTMDIRKGGLR